MIDNIIVGLALRVLTSLVQRIHLYEWSIAWAIHLGRRYHPFNKQFRQIDEMCWYVKKNPWVIDSSF